MNQPIVSVVLPTYNNESTISRALASVLLQEESDFEIVVVDDCSTDQTPAVLAKIAASDQRVRVVRTPRNSGEGISRTLGIQQALGLFIAAQDGDDISLPGRLRNQSEYLCAHSDIDWVGSWAYTMTSAGQLLTEVKKLTDPAAIKTRLVDGQMCIVGASAMIRRDALLDCQGYRSVHTPDYDLARRFIERYRIAVLPSHLYAYVPVVESKQSGRYRQTFRLMLRHRRDYGSKKTDARFLGRLLWNGLQGVVPFAPGITRFVRGARRRVHLVAPPGYEAWLRRLEEFAHKVGEGAEHLPKNWTVQ